MLITGETIISDITLDVYTANNTGTLKALCSYITGVTTYGLVYGKIIYDNYI